jgi:hypothetical protein
MGGGKGSSNTQVELTPEQRRVIGVQTDALENTFMPAYQKTIGMAQGALDQTSPAAVSAANTAMDVSRRAGVLQEVGGTGAYTRGLSGQSQLADYQKDVGSDLFNRGSSGQGRLADYQLGTGRNLFEGGASQLGALFSPQYKKEQIDSALQPAREEIREQVGSQNAMYGGAGGAGSSRYALARLNLNQLGEQRLGTVAAQTSADIEGRRQRAAESLMGSGATSLGQAGNLFGSLTGAGSGSLGQSANLFGSLTGAGQSGLSGAQQAAAGRVGLAQTPQDILAKYASVVYGTPQASTAPNFSGTQGQRASSKGFGF